MSTQKLRSVIVPEGLWTDPIDWNLYATGQWEIHVPFHVHVRPRKANQIVDSISGFLQLPTELQLDILDLCDSTTLFSLMHASSAMRKMAVQVFWSDPASWYLVHAPWLYSGGYPGYTFDDARALAYMKQIEIPMIMDLYDKPLFPYEAAELKVSQFWETLQRVLPNVKDAIISTPYTDCNVAGPAISVGGWVQMVVEKCPVGIRTLVSTLQKEPGYKRRLKRMLWQGIRGECTLSLKWEAVVLKCPRKIIIAPHKSFHGPVGAYQRVGYDYDTYDYLEDASELLNIQATESYYLQHPQERLVCAQDGCDMQFEQPGQWTKHIIETSHAFLSEPPGSALQALFKAHRDKVGLIKSQCEDANKRLRTAWGDEGTQQREDAENAFLDQIANDPAYECEGNPRESLMWRNYVFAMNNPAAVIDRGYTTASPWGLSDMSNLGPFSRF